MCVAACWFLLLGLDHVVARNIHQPSGGLRRGSKPTTHAAQELRDDLRAAVAEALGEGHDIHHGHLEKVQQRLQSTWRSLATNEQGRVDRRSLRYVVHRYFLQTYSLSIVGLEPAQVSGARDEAALLTEFAPNYVRSEMEGKAAQSGFSLEDAVAMVATLERLVLDSGKNLLKKSIQSVGLDVDSTLSREDATRALEAYTLRWMLGEDTEGLVELESNKTLLAESLDDWVEIAAYLAGELSSFQHARKYEAPKPSSASAWSQFKPQYSFHDLDDVVGQITMGFGNYWETECSRVKSLLTDMDKKGAGRVTLNDFYAAAMQGEWRFSESKDYLNQLGALDESWSQGPQVIITNYMQAASNCIVSAPHYRVCCRNECEDILGEVEAVVNGPLGDTATILAVLENHTVSLNDRTMKVSDSLRKQLDDVAAASPGGKVPLHGRLFAQWLHYAFPQECPFPHKSGTTVALTPSEFGEQYLSSEDAMIVHAAQANADSLKEPAEMKSDSDIWMQWSQEEELLSEHTHLHAPWEAGFSFSSSSFFLLLAIGAVLGFAKISSSANGGATKDLLPTRAPFMKVHSC